MTPAKPTWPPPPTIADPRTEHDGFLRDRVLRSSAKPPVTRLRLVRALCKERGIDFRQSRAFVNDYCDRKAMLMPLRGMEAWGLTLTLSGMFAFVLVMNGDIWFMRRNLAAATTYAERTAVLIETRSVFFACLKLALVLVCLVLIFGIRAIKKARRDAEAARKKLAA